MHEYNEHNMTLPVRVNFCNITV